MNLGKTQVLGDENFPKEWNPDRFKYRAVFIQKTDEADVTHFIQPPCGCPSPASFGPHGIQYK